MYKFTNGLVVFDEKTRDNYIKTGYRLVEVDSSTEQIYLSAEQKEALTKTMIEAINENNSNDGIIEEKYTRNNSKTTKNRK
jgi:uncharacterized protein (DUF1015 family)